MSPQMASLQVRQIMKSHDHLFRLSGGMIGISAIAAA